MFDIFNEKYNNKKDLLDKKLYIFNKKRFDNFITPYNKTQFIKWAIKNFNNFEDVEKFIDEKFFMIFVKNHKLYDLLFEKYNNNRLKNNLHIIKYKDRDLHIARYYNGNFSKFENIANTKLSNKEIMYDDVIFKKWFYIVNKNVSNNYCNPCIKYKDFYYKEKIQRQLKNNNNTSGFIYGILDPRHPEWIKIGCTSNLDERLAQYKTYTPYDNIRYIDYKYTPNKFRSEKILHEKFKNHRGNGEWFKITEDEFKNTLNILNID